MKQRVSWFIKLWDRQRPTIFGLGECAPLEGLSKEPTERIEGFLSEWEANINQHEIVLPSNGFNSLQELNSFLSVSGILPDFSSLRFAAETAVLDLASGGKRTIFKNDFLTGRSLPINGLIWIGGLDYMLQQIDIKIKDGFRCIKIKVGSLNFEKECDILQYIRRKYYREEIVIRLDANGAFKPEDAMFKLADMARFGVHSIEQPLKVGAKELEELCRHSPIPIALDEELIGVYSYEERRSLLTRLRPTYIILKPSLHGGLFSCEEWIQLAESLGVGWWITSALESSIGLNAIAQFAAQYNLQIPQGLGTGLIYLNNMESPLTVGRGTLSYNQQINWDLTALFPEPDVSQE